eukprot:TCALIF_03419-PA protein Name:"Protein of unknown function" AED:0.32 eAED:0.32 QI:0/0/0/0.75/1/1/4/0/224
MARNKNPETLIDCLLYLFNEHCRSLKFSFTDKRYYAQIVALLLKDQLKLEELNLYGVWLQDNIKADLVLALKKLDHLTQLSLPHIADDAIIHAISRSCPKLRHLDVSGTSRITDSGLSDICGAVGDTLGLSAVGEIVNYVPNLSSLGSFPFVVKAVHYIWENYECSDQLKLSMRVIGKLDEWLVNPFEATELEDEIQHYNLDVKLYGKPKGTFIFEQERFDDVF